MKQSSWRHERMEKVSFREMLFLLKISRNLQMLFAAIKHLVEGLSVETFLDSKSGKVPDLLCGYMQANSVHYRTAVNFVLENINKKQSVEVLSPGTKCFKCK
jgi:hypothetical protein